MAYIKKYLKYIVGLLVIILIIFLGYHYSQKNPGKEDTTPVPIADWTPYKSASGFSFRYPTSAKLETNGNTMTVAGVSIETQILNCKNPVFTTKITSGVTLYGFPAQIDEAQKTAYICNNTKTACLNITKDPNYSGGLFQTKVTEGFFHSFISSLDISPDFNKIPCAK
jgi:hypothetical protein